MLSMEVIVHYVNEKVTLVSKVEPKTGDIRFSSDKQYRILLLKHYKCQYGNDWMSLLCLRSGKVIHAKTAHMLNTFPWTMSEGKIS